MTDGMIPKRSIHFTLSERPQAKAALEELTKRYGQSALRDASHLVTIGGDGTTLRAMHSEKPLHIPIFSMRIPGSVGALGNRLAFDNLLERINRARRYSFLPLELIARSNDGKLVTQIGFNEVAIVRDSPRAVRLKLSMKHGHTSIEAFGDGIIVATPLGSRGYCRSVCGPLLLVDSQQLSIAGIALRTPADGLHLAVNDQAVITVDVIDPIKRPARVEADGQRINGNIAAIEVRTCLTRAATLLKDPTEPFELV